MDIRKIRKLIELINETGIGEIEVTSGEESVRISRLPTQAATPTPPTVPAPVTAEEPPKQTPTKPTEKSLSAEQEQFKGHAVKAPMVGTVYLASTPGAKPLVEVGQHINVGDTLCLIEAMKMFNKIEADKTGVISARLVENEQPVEYDQSLFIIDPDE